MKKINFKNLLPKKDSKSLKKGAFSTGAIIIVIVMAVLLNLVVGQLPSKYTKIDVSASQLYSIGDTTKELVSGLTENVSLYLIAEDGAEDTQILELLERYADLSSYITVEQKDPVVNPSFAKQYTDDDVASNSVIVAGTKRNKVINYSEIYESTVNYQTYSYDTTGFDGEGQITSAIDYVTSEDLPVMYVLQGHEEASMSTSMISAIEKQNIEMQDLNLVSAGTVPDDADCLFIYAPMKDFSEDEATAIINYLDGGGKAFILSAYTTSDLPNFRSVLNAYGVNYSSGIVLDGDANHYVSGNPMYLVPDIQSCDATGSLSSDNSFVLLPIAQAIKTLDTYRDTITITNMLTSSDSAYIKTDPENMTSYSKEDGDESGAFALGVSITEPHDEGDTKIVYLSSSNLFADQIDSVVSGGNLSLLTNAMSYLCEQQSSVSIPSKSMELSYLTLTAAASGIWSVFTIGVIPVFFLIIGGVIWFKRRRR